MEIYNSRMAQLFFHSFLRGDVRLQYFRTGGDKPPLVFLHGLAASSFTWGRLPLLFEPEYDCIFLDFRGHGLSDLGGEPVTSELMSEDVFALLQGLGIERASLAGHFHGAMVAMQFAARHPQMAQALVLLDPPLRADPNAQRSVDVEKMIEAWQNLKNSSFAEYKATFGKPNPWMHEDQLFQLFKSVRVFKPAMLPGLYSARLPWQDLARQIQCPGLVFATDEEKPLVPPDVESALTQLWPACKVLRIAQSNHMLHLQHVRSIEPPMDLFLRRVRKSEKQR